ncbi:Transcriptional regulator [Gordonia sp. KTR9] [Mycolicibacterium parafortuitum]|uniref:Transcriptional regulator [Gordonia sp. KTR9] n=1 Tax=Mycolicibacterium parafortuitum TaxID=39692 RepID=A0A375YEQ6_MYCPF|nr:Transcriptional regulator [Gordonia sp. KTR9] [Mycolicibacterium parafortuitum]
MDRTAYHRTVPRKQSATRAGIAPEAETKSARTRARILDAAAHVLSVKGYAGTRLSDVAEYAEIQAPAIYYYFSSREELIEEVMFAGIAEMRRYLKDVVDGLPADMSPMDKILTAVEAHLRHELELSDYTTASIRNSGQIPEHLRSRQRKEEVGYGRLWRKLFDEALAEGMIDPDLDVRTAQLLVMGGLNWAAEWFDPRKFSIDEVVRNAQTLVRNGLLSHK